MKNVNLICNFSRTHFFKPVSELVHKYFKFLDFNYVLVSKDQSRVYTAKIASNGSHPRDNGIMHQHLKPGNILMCADGHVMAMPRHSILSYFLKIF